MILKKNHFPILLHSSINNLLINDNGIYIDGTFGTGNHSRLIINKLSKKGHLYAIDRDPTVYNSRIINQFRNKHNFTFINGLISNIKTYTLQYNILGKVDGVILDLGISKIQLNDATRGFSFKQNGPLDMRMNNYNGITAKQWINTATKTEISYILKTYGQEKFANAIAQLIIKHRQKYIISTTFELTNLIKEAIPIIYQNKYHLHPATRTFQAIRMYINNESKELELCLDNLLSVLTIKGRLVIITFHSIETKILKQIINKYLNYKNIYYSNKYLTSNNIYKPNFMYLKFLKKIKPSKQEIFHNSSSKCAILRIYEKNII